ncbi:MAG: hypothetical protein ABIV06_06485 [Thermoanaerobaculia bacterium]
MTAELADPLLAQLREAAAQSAAMASDALGRILIGEAAPILWRTIRGQLEGVPPAEQEEVHSAALLRLTERLQQWLAGNPEVEIENLRAYVAATGANGCRAWLRSRHPERTRLQNQLRRALLQNLRDAQGRDRLGLLTLTGLATRSDLALPLDLPEAELEACWE